MSDYYTYRIVAPVQKPFESVEAFIDAAAEASVYFDLTSGPSVTSTEYPSFGRGTSYEASFPVWGIGIANGILSIGVFAANLERTADEDDVDDRGKPIVGTRLERILSFLSEVTTGQVGEIQGAYSVEGWGFDIHAHPVIRCADGRLRVARTPPTRDDLGSWYQPEEEAMSLIPTLLPTDLVTSGFKGAFLDLDLAVLRKRFPATAVVD
jgi:hypothetical protein